MSMPNKKVVAPALKEANLSHEVDDSLSLEGLVTTPLPFRIFLVFLQVVVSRGELL